MKFVYSAIGTALVLLLVFGIHSKVRNPASKAMSINGETNATDNKVQDRKAESGLLTGIAAPDPGGKTIPRNWVARSNVTFEEYEAAAKRSFDLLSTGRVPEIQVFAATLSASKVPENRLYSVVRQAFEGATIRARCQSHIDEHQEKYHLAISRILEGDGSEEAKRVAIEMFRKQSENWSMILEQELRDSISVGIRNMMEAADGMSLDSATNLLFITPGIPAEPLPDF